MNLGMHSKSVLPLAMLFAIAPLSLAQVPSPQPSTDTTIRPPVIVEGAEPKYAAPNTLDRIGRIWAPVYINGKGPFRLVLDTAANSSAIIPSVADRLSITPQQTGQAKLIGITGTAVVQTAAIDSMTIGDLALGSRKLPIVADVFGGAEGVLSPQGFADKRIFVDFRNDLIRIARSTGQAAEKGYTRISISTDRRQLPMFDIRVGGVKTKAILSTGGQQSIGNRSLREALIKREREAKEQGIVGVTLDVTKGQSIAVPPIHLGDLQLRNANITFAEPYIFEQWKLTREPALLIGMDVIGSLEAIVIDYKMQEMHLKAKR